MMLNKCIIYRYISKMDPKFDIKQTIRAIYRIYRIYRLKIDKYRYYPYCFYWASINQLSIYRQIRYRPFIDFRRNLVTIHGVHFWVQERGRENGKRASALGWNIQNICKASEKCFVQEKLSINKTVCYFYVLTKMCEIKINKLFKLNLNSRPCKTYLNFCVHLNCLLFV